VSDWSSELAMLQAAGVVLKPGLSSAELSAAERVVGAPFPPDLADFLQVALPAGEQYPNWRALETPEIAQALAWPFDGIAFDIEHNAFWWPAWGERPTQLIHALAVAQRHVVAAPRLIPVFSHRYLPALPREAGNPVFSVHQTDVIYYGGNLSDYWAREFRKVTSSEISMPEPRRVPFWSELVQANNALGG
jgi:hypothetical protein